MQQYAKDNRVTLPDWCRAHKQKGGEEIDKASDSNECGEEIAEVPPIDVRVGEFVHKEFEGSVFAGTIVSTDTCKTTKKKM